jgi:hypothetical protein
LPALRNPLIFKGFFLCVAFRVAGIMSFIEYSAMQVTATGSGV